MEKHTCMYLLHSIHARSILQQNQWPTVQVLCTIKLEYLANHIILLDWQFAFTLPKLKPSNFLL